MEAYTFRTALTQNLSALLIPRFVGVRDAGDAHSITSGSLLDLPPIYLGTSGLNPDHLSVNFSDLDESMGYEVSLTRTSPANGEAQERVQVTQDFENTDQEMIQLEEAADRGDESAFIEVARNLNWEERSSTDFIRGIQFSFNAGANMYARRLAEQGARQFPDHNELRKYAKILAPPEVIQRNLPPDPTLRANRDWLKAHWGEYRGKWVALHNGDLIGAEPNLQDLKQSVGKREGILFTKVS